MRHRPGFLGCRFQRVRKSGADGVGKGNMGDAAGAEEASRAVPGAVEKLVNDHEVPGGHLLPKGAACADRHDVADTATLQRIYICAVV